MRSGKGYRTKFAPEIVWPTLCGIESFWVFFLAFLSFCEKHWRFCSFRVWKTPLWGVLQQKLLHPLWSSIFGLQRGVCRAVPRWPSVCYVHQRLCGQRYVNLLFWIMRFNVSNQGLLLFGLFWPRTAFIRFRNGQTCTPTACMYIPPSVLPSELCNKSMVRLGSLHKKWPDVWLQVRCPDTNAWCGSSSVGQRQPMPNHDGNPKMQTEIQILCW